MKKVTNFQWSWGWDNTHKLRVVRWHGSSFIWPTSLFGKSRVHQEKREGGLVIVEFRKFQKDRVSPEKELLWAKLRFQRALSIHEGNRQTGSTKCPGRPTGGKSLTESSKIPSKSTCFLWWASAVSCDSVRRKPVLLRHQTEMLY